MYQSQSVIGSDRLDGMSHKQHQNFHRVNST